MPNVTTRVDFYQKVYTFNVTATSITNPTPTTTDMLTNTGANGVFNMAGRQADSGPKGGANIAALVFHGVGANNSTAVAKLYGWRRVTKEGTLMVPVPLLLLALTLGNTTGVASTPVSASEKFVDTITATTAYTAAGAYEIISPTSDEVAMVKVDTAGFEGLGVLLHNNSSSTSVNCLIATF